MSENWVVLIGVKGGPAIYPKGALPTSHLLRLAGKTIVVDCAAGVTEGITRQGVALKDIDAIFITHLHSDHYLHLGPLLHTAWTAGLKRTVTVYGPAGTDDYLRHFFASMQSDIETRIADEGRPDIRTQVAFRALDEGNIGNDLGVAISAMRTIHPPIIDCFAFRFEADGTSIVFGADTAYCEALGHFAKGAKLLIHEAMFPEGIDRLVARIGNGDGRLRKHMFASHTPVADTGKIASIAGCGTLVINHMVPIDDPLITESDWSAAARTHWKGKLVIGRDGMRLAL